VKRIAAALVLSTIFLTAIGAEAPAAVAQTTTVAPTTVAPTTQAPDTTQAPAETTVPASGDTSNAPWWILIMVGLGILILVVVFATRGSKSKIIAAAPPPAKSWKDYAREGYASSRWLYDAMGEDMAVWRGNAQFDDATAVGSSAGTSKAETWQQINARMSTASDALYALEAAAPDQRTAQTARNTVNALHSTRNALDARAESRFAYRSAERQEHDSTTLMQAREREVRSSRNLVEARNALALALTDLSTIA